MELPKPNVWVAFALTSVLVVGCNRLTIVDSSPDEHAPEAVPAATGTVETTGAVARSPTDCAPTPPPAERVAGSLTVRDPPDDDDRTIYGRLRSHSSGALAVESPRTWVGPPVPGFVPLLEDDAELHLLEHDDGNVIALYREMYGAPSCTLGEDGNCNFFVRAWDRCGEPMWAHRLNDFMSRPDRLEVQDLRVDDRVVYFNEACQSYSKEAGGKCSALVALDPQAGEVLWRTTDLVSNNAFIVQGDYLITGYGFTAEPDFLYVVRRSDGEVVHRTKLATAHERLRVEEDAVLIIQRYPDQTERFLLDGFDGDSPTLRKAQP